MKKQSKYTVQYRRKREGKTNYKKRLKLLLSEKPRLVVRLFLRNISAQVIGYSPEGDKVIASADGKDLEKLGWKYNKGNLPSAYLAGFLAGKKVQEKGVREAILDIGLRKPAKGSRVFACLKGALDSGLDIHHSEEVFPSEDRIIGKHIESYAEKGSFSGYEKKGIKPKDISKTFENIKNKVSKTGGSQE